MITIIVEALNVYDALKFNRRVDVHNEKYGIDIWLDITLCNTFNDTRWVTMKVDRSCVLSYCLQTGRTPKELAESLVNYQDHVLRFEYGGDANVVEEEEGA